MKKINLSRLFAGLLVALFLSAPVLSCFAESSFENKKSQEFMLTGNAGSHANADNLLSFEEKEKEERTEDSQSLILLCIISDVTPSPATVFLFSWSHRSSPHSNNTLSLPLYLYTRKLLI